MILKAKIKFTKQDIKIIMNSINFALYYSSESKKTYNDDEEYNLSYQFKLMQLDRKLRKFMYPENLNNKYKTRKIM